MRYDLPSNLVTYRALIFGFHFLLRFGRSFCFRLDLYALRKLLQLPDEGCCAPRHFDKVYCGRFPVRLQRSKRLWQKGVRTKAR